MRREIIVKLTGYFNYLLPSSFPPKRFMAGTKGILCNQKHTHLSSITLKQRGYGGKIQITNNYLVKTKIGLAGIKIKIILTRKAKCQNQSEIGQKPKTQKQSRTSLLLDVNPVGDIKSKIAYEGKSPCSRAIIKKMVLDKSAKAFAPPKGVQSQDWAFLVGSPPAGGGVRRGGSFIKSAKYEILISCSCRPSCKRGANSDIFQAETDCKS